MTFDDYIAESGSPDYYKNVLKSVLDVLDAIETNDSGSKALIETAKKSIKQSLSK